MLPLKSGQNHLKEAYHHNSVNMKTRESKTNIKVAREKDYDPVLYTVRTCCYNKARLLETFFSHYTLQLIVHVSN